MNFGWEPGNDKQNYVVCISVSRDNGKITRKDFKIITTTTVWWNVAEMWILKKWILSVQQEKIMDFEYCEGYLRSIYIKRNIIMVVLILIQLSFADW